MQSAPTYSSPAGRKKPHCRKCGLPMKGHRKSECYGATERFESVFPDGKGLAGSDGEKKDLICFKQSSSSPSRVTRASSRVGQNLPTSDKGESPVVQPIIGAPSKGQTNLKLKSKQFSASRDGDVGDKTVINQEDTSSFFDQEEKPVSTPSDIESSSNAKARRSSAIVDTDEEVELPSPKAFIYASSDFLELGEAGTAVRDRILKNDEGKSYHAGVFYTPTPVPNSQSYAYKEWVVVGRGEGAEALVKHVIRLADSQSVLRNRAPGSFIVGNELEIVEGPRVLTIPQLLFGTCVAVLLFMYIHGDGSHFLRDRFFVVYNKNEIRLFSKFSFLVVKMQGPNLLILYPLAFVYLMVQNVQQISAQIPSIKSFAPSNSYFVVDSTIQIIVDPAFADASSGGSGQGTLSDFAQTFRDDLISVTGFSNISQAQNGDVHVNVSSDSFQSPTVFLTLGSSSNLTLFNGKPTGEGYEFEITEKMYTIRGVEPIGAWWGTRTFLQQAVLSIANGSYPAKIPTGTGEDNPGWEIRGFMLDAGRHWFEIPFLTELCIYASFFKINEFHLHASDFIYDPSFLYGQDWRELYTGFRFQPSAESPIFSLVPELNESWTKDQFTTLQTTCSNHGVRIVPEIDTPAHSLVISKWKPELMISGTPDLLNLTYPETLPTIKSIWEEILPWFTSDEVSIGADEYSSSLGDDYITFVNNMSEYISHTGGKSIRIWGTNEPSTTESLSISTNITIQHWWFPGGSIPVQLMNEGYSIINSDQVFLYLDGKFSDGGQFPWTLNTSKLWLDSTPDGQGWAPNIFSATDPTNNTAIENPLLRGSIMAFWNDWGNNATTPLEVYYQLAQSLAAFGEKTWAGSRGGMGRENALTLEGFNEVYPLLNAASPGQNLNRALTPVDGLGEGEGTRVVFSYENISQFPFVTGYESVGPPYTLSFTVKPSNSSTSSANSTALFLGLDSVLYLNSLTFKDPSTNIRYPLGVDLPSDVFTSVEVHSTVNYTYALFNGSQSDDSELELYYWTSNLDIWGEYMEVVNMSFAAPSHVIGLNGFEGELVNVSLRLGA